MRAAYEAGITFYDTAPNYALGRSEMILGEALKDVREHVILNTKFGHHTDDHLDFSEDLIKTTIEGSLKRLQTRYLDSVILHNPDQTILAGATNHFEVLKQLKIEFEVLYDHHIKDDPLPW